MNQEMAINKQPQDLEEEKDLLIIQETAAAASPFFNKPAAAAANRSPCTSSGSAPSFSFGSVKRPSSENPTTHSIFGLPKIPLSSPPSLRRSSSDPYTPPLPPVLEEEDEEPTLLPQRNVELECHGIPLSNSIASNKLPLRPRDLKRSFSDPVPSPAKTFSGSSNSPHTELLRKTRDCMREMSQKWDELFKEDTANNNSNGETKESNSTDTTMEDGNEGYVEAVSVEKKGEALILHFKCPCGKGYQIVLLRGNCYYKLM